MSSDDPERWHDAQQAIHIRPRQAGKAHDQARQALAAELERHEASRSERETMLGALRAVWALSERWALGINDTGPAAAAEVQDAIRGTL